MATFTQEKDRIAAESRLRNQMRNFASTPSFDPYLNVEEAISVYYPHHDDHIMAAVNGVVPEPDPGMGLRWHVVFVSLVLMVGAAISEASVLASVLLIVLSLTIWFGIAFRLDAPRAGAYSRRADMATFLLEKYPGFWIEELAQKRKAAEDSRRDERAKNGRPFIAPPSPQPFGVSHIGAEQMCAEWMWHLGEERALTTQATGDGGVDITSPEFIAQVKHYSDRNPVGAPEIRELAGVASVDGRTPLFFTSSYYTPGAIEFADNAGIVLFTYSAEEGTLAGVNSLGKEARSSGLG